MIKKETLKKLNDNYNKDKNNHITNKILNKVQMVDLITDNNDILDVEFNINIDTHGIMDQKSTGRCWAYAGLNILREKVIEKCNLDNFDLSGSYIAFYDKLEKFNTYINRLVKYKEEGKDLYDRYVFDLLNTGMDDGSVYKEFADLVKKYGVVPKSIYSNSFGSNDTYEVNEILSRLIRKFYIELENGNKLVDKYLNYAYKVLCSIYGTPTTNFDFAYRDSDGKYHIDKNLSPKKFYDKYIGIDLLDDYVTIYSYEDEKYKYNNLYRIEESSLIEGVKDSIILNLKYEEIEKLMIKQLKNNEPVYINVSTTSKSVDGIWIDIMKRYGDILNIDLKLSNNDIIKTNGTTEEHAVIITGVLIINNEIKKWKVENSWGNMVGKNGYFVVEEEFIRNYLIGIVINKKYLTNKEKELLTKKPIEVSKWDYKFC